MIKMQGKNLRKVNATPGRMLHKSPLLVLFHFSPMNLSISDRVVGYIDFNIRSVSVVNIYVMQNMFSFWHLRTIMTLAVYASPI